MKELSSPQNPIFKKYLSLEKSSGVKKEGLSLFSGEKVVHDVCLKSPQLVEAVISTQKIGFPPYLKPKHITMSPSMFSELDFFNTRKPLAVVQVPSFPKWESSSPQGLELLLPVQDPANMGAIIRTAFAFHIKKIILLSESAHPYHPKSIRASSGYVLNMNFEIGPSIRDLSLSKILTLDMEGQSLNQFQWPQNSFLLVGEEGQGLPQNLSLETLKIPMHEECESLNVGAALGIALYSYSQSYPF